MKKEPEDKKPIWKPKFAPKPLARKPKIEKPLVPKIEPVETKEAIIDKALIEKLKTAKNEPGFGRRDSKHKKEAQVSFGAINSLSSFNIPKFSNTDKAIVKVEKEYVEPWDYESNYPISLPLRQPYAGDPEILNEEEFGDISTSLLSKGTQLNPANELGLIEARQDSEMVFFQLPSVLPLLNNNNSDQASSSNSKNAKIANKGCKLNELPGGYLGKLLVYRSGKVKMKLGDVLFDVYPGSDCKFAQDLVGVNLKEKHCSVIGQLGPRVMVTPDIDSMLNSVFDLDRS